MAEAFIGEIRLVAFSYPPQGWMFCQGQILAIAQYNALFALLGTTYGGNGTTNFALPDLRSRVPVGTGQGTGMSNITPGQVGGVESTALSILNMPTHNHVASGTASMTIGTVASNPNSTPSATNNVLAASGGGPGSASVWSDSVNTPLTLANPETVSVNVQAAGGSQQFSIRNPYLGMNYAICIQGIFPSRN